MSTEVLLEGSLAAVDLSALLQLAQWGDWDAVLVLPDGEIAVHGSQVLGAHFGPHRGLPALFEHFLATGRFSVEARRGQGEGLGPSMELLLAGHRLADEWARVRTRVVSGEVEGLRLDGPVWQEVRLAGRLRTALALPIAEAIDSGALQVRGELAPDAVRETTSLDELLSQGRRSVKSGDLDSALRAFKAALLQAPDHPIARQNLKRVQQMRSR